MNIATKRVYEPYSKDDGYRVLVDRLWPRGIKKEVLKLDEWCKDVAPSNELRQKFHEGSLDFEEFSGLYEEELIKTDAVKDLLKRATDRGKITLLYAAKSSSQNHAIVLRDYLKQNEQDISDRL